MVLLSHRVQGGSAGRRDRRAPSSAATTTNDIIVVDQRIPRTVLALLVGAALGVAGALMQGLTRNPLADPGLLGVSAGAAFAMALGRRPSARQHLLGLRLVLVPRRRRRPPSWCTAWGRPAAPARPPSPSRSPEWRSARCSPGSPTTITLLYPSDLPARCGSGTPAPSPNATGTSSRTIAPFIGVGLLLAAVAARGLNAVALGDDLAVSLGGNLRRTRIVGDRRRHPALRRGDRSSRPDLVRRADGAACRALDRRPRPALDPRVHRPARPDPDARRRRPGPARSSGPASCTPVWSRRSWARRC